MTEDVDNWEEDLEEDAVISLVIKNLSRLIWLFNFFPIL